MKKIVLILTLCLLCISFMGCNANHDYITVANKSCIVFDDIKIEIKEEYFYDKHEKFTVDEDTVGVTIYFSKDNSSWNVKEGE